MLETIVGIVMIIFAFALLIVVGLWSIFAGPDYTYDDYIKEKEAAGLPARRR